MDKSERRKKFEEALKKWPRGATTGNVLIKEQFGAIPIRKDDKPDRMREVEAVRPGQVVQLRIHPNQNANQSLEMVAAWYAKGYFVPTKKHLTAAGDTTPPDDEERAPGEGEGDGDGDGDGDGS